MHIWPVSPNSSEYACVSPIPPSPPVGHQCNWYGPGGPPHNRAPRRGGEGSKQGPPPLEGPSLLLGSCVLFRICSQWRAGGCIFGASSGSVVLESGRPWLGIERPILAPFQMARITSLDLSRRIAPTAGNKQRRWRLSFMFISVHYAYWTRVPQLVEICSHLAHFTLSICGTPIQLVGARLPCYVCFAFVRCEPNVVGPPGPTRLRWHFVRQKWTKPINGVHNTRAETFGCSKRIRPPFLIGSSLREGKGPEKAPPR